MQIKAIHRSTGKILMSNMGNMPESQFRKMVLANFPAICPSDIEIIGVGSSILGGPRPESKMPGNEVVWRGSFTDLGGCSNMNREICLRLPQHGFKVKTDILSTFNQLDSMTYGMIQSMQYTRLANENNSTLVVGFVPMAVRNIPGRRVVFFTMMETQKLHKEFVDRCNAHATEIWVPCEFYVDVFRESGVRKPIYLIPLGVNVNLYTPGLPEPSLRYTDVMTGKRVEKIQDEFRFMSLFGWSDRKGPDVLCRSYISEFSGSEDVCLVIYSRYMGSTEGTQEDFIHSEIKRYYEEVGNPNPPRIYHCNDAIPIDELPGCYCAADCFVFCSRGEGFGLPVIEAAACGVPVISAYHTAMTEYLNDDVAYLVEPEGYGIRNELTWISEHYRDQEFAIMGEDSEKKFAKNMRHVFDKRDEAYSKAMNFYDLVHSKYTWDICAKSVAERLKHG